MTFTCPIEFEATLSRIKVHKYILLYYECIQNDAYATILIIRPTLDEVLTWIDVETLTLLFSMMLIVSVVSETGIFNYMGYWAFRITKGKVKT